MRTILSFLAAFLLAGCGNQSEDSGKTSGFQRKAKLKLVSFYQTNLPVLGPNIIELADRVNQASGGSIDMKVYEPNKLVAPMEILEAVSAGQVEAGYAASGFWMGKIPAAPIFSSIPFGPGTSELLAWLFHGNGMKLYQEMYDQHGYHVKVLVCTVIPPETSGWFIHPINSKDDLRGLKMRFYGLGGRVMEKMGVAVNILPGAEIFPALEKKVIDATEFSLPAMDEKLGFHKLAKYNYFPGWHQQSTAFELLINKDVWNGLSREQQSIIEMASGHQIVRSIAVGEGMQAAVMKRNEEERGVSLMTWPDELMTEFKARWLEVVAEQTTADAFFNRVWNDLSAFRKEYAIWGDRAYLK